MPGPIRNQLPPHRLNALKTGMLAGLFCLMCSMAGAQRLPVGEALTMDDGLCFRDVTAVTQDVNGLMWFGTRQGLNRYDGYRFLRFAQDPKADVHFPADDILSGSTLFKDDSTLWLVADKKLYALNIRSFRYQNLSQQYHITGDVNFLKKACDGSMWVVWDSGEDQFLWRIDPTCGSKPIASVKRGRREFTSLATDSKGNAWWSTVTEGLRKYDPSGTLLDAFKPDSFNWFGTTMYYTPLFVDSKDRLFIIPKSQQALWQYVPAAKKHVIVADQLATVGFNIAEDRLGNIWFTTRNQLWRLDPTGNVADFSKVITGTLSFSALQAVFEDQANLLWVATDNGLVKFPNQKQIFESRFDVPGVEWGNAMRGIFDDRDGRIYAFCENGEVGLHCFDPKTQTTKFYYIPDPEMPNKSLLREPRYFVSDHQRNAVWTVADHLIQIDLKTMQPVIQLRLEGQPKKFGRNPLLRLHDGRFLLGGSLDHLIRYNPVTGQSFSLHAETDTSVSMIDLDCFLESTDGTYWVGSVEHGVFHLDTTGRILNQYSRTTSPALSADHILCLYEEGDSVLWLGTFGGGLNRLDLRHDRIEIFTTKEGLANDNVTGILADMQGNVWAATYHGLSCYLQQERIFQNYFEEDGLSSNEFNHASAFRDREGHLWFGGMNGVQTFNPSEIIHQQVNPPLTWTGFLKYNRQHDSLEVTIRGDAHMEQVRISPYDSYVQFSWTLPNYFKPDQNKYYVWLEGLEDGWTYIGHQPLIRYHKLPSGDYTLHVKGADSKGNWSKTELSIPLFVKPLFFKTWWFILLSIVSMGGLIYAFVRYRYRRLLEMEKMRTRIAGDLHDEVGSMLSGLAMQAEIMEMDPSKADPAKLKHLTDLSRLTLSKMRDVVWSIDSRRDLVRDLVDRMRENAEEMLTPREIRFHFEISDLPMDKKLKVDTRQHLFLFFKEAITNIVKHASADEVIIRFGQWHQGVELTISDNGTPERDIPSGTGMGLQNMEMRAHKLGGTFRISREKGFTVSLHIDSL